MALFTYLEDTQRFLREGKQDFIDPGDLISWINRARREVAMRAECIRRLTPISGAVVSATVTAAGSGYSNNPTVTITKPDFPSGQLPFPNGAQATALAIVQGGQIVAIDISYGGSGYFQPTVTITDTTGTGATATLSMSYINQLNLGQEAYAFSDVDLSQFPGVEAIYMIKSVSLIFSNYRYSLACYDFSTYQARIRNYVASQYQYVPAVCAQYGQGVGGSFYMYPPPSQAYQLEFDALCLPSDLATDQDVEAIPAPWTDAIAYLAASFGYMQLQNLNYAKYYQQQFDEFVSRYSRYARPGRATNKYGRY